MGRGGFRRVGEEKGRSLPESERERERKRTRRRSRGRRKQREPRLPSAGGEDGFEQELREGKAKPMSAVDQSICIATWGELISLGKLAQLPVPRR